MVLLLLPAPGRRGEMDFALEVISVRPLVPDRPDMREEMIRWRKVYTQEMAPVREQWSRLVETIHRGRITDLPLVCPEFQDRLRRLDRRRLFTVVDPVVKSWLGRGLDLLDGAAGQCRRDRFFALGFRLYKARYVVESIDRRLERYQ